MLRAQAVLAALMLVGTVVGCSDDPITLEQAPPGEDVGPTNDADVGGEDEEGEPDVPDEDVEEDVPVVRDCSQHLFGDVTYNCDLLDPCDTENFELRLACCDCDQAYCEPPLDCPECAVDADCAGGQTCVGGQCQDDTPPQIESCMACHNGAQLANDYSGPGLPNPHPFPGAENIACSGCHGGNPSGAGKIGSHVPPPPAIGDREQQTNDPQAWFNRLTLTGIDKLEPENYTSPDHPNQTFSNLDYLQFINPGDLRVVSDGKGCGAGGCHGDQHGQWVPRTPLATTTGFFSGWRFSNGVDNRIPEYRGRDKDGDSLADTAFRAVQNPSFNPANSDIGEVGRLVEMPEVAGFFGPMRDNFNYDAATLNNHVVNAQQDPARPNRIRTGSPLETLVDECASIVCGDCHLSSAGANNRYADFRSSGCTACHMAYSFDGRSRSGDPNINRLEPINPDAIVAPERAHVEDHQIRNVARFLENGVFSRGITDRACVGCHQGSNRTVLQFWGIRLDQNQDLTGGFQYPANPQNFTDTAQDERLYDPGTGNQTFNGRVAAQHILTEDYDGDGRDDTPPDIHYEKGMGCIDCHGGYDLHGGVAGNPNSGKIRSRKDQAVAIRCESCHGSLQTAAPTVPCQDYERQNADCTTDSAGNPMRHVTRDPTGNVWLKSRVTGERHYVPQVIDVTANNNRTHPITQRAIFSPLGSYAMGRADGNPATGQGPVQINPVSVRNGFSHTDNVDCVGCHGSWTNNCIGCHLKTQYDANPQNFNFSNITGERILLALANADFIYQSPVPFYLGVNSHGKVTQISPAGRFFRYQDLNGVESDVFGFGDRLGEGNNPAGGGRNAFPGLNHYMMATHAIRGKAEGTKEGPKYCVSCHLTQEGLDNFGDEYNAFRDAYTNNDFANLDFDLLQEHIGQNTGNQLNSPLWVHMAAGLGSGLFLFDETGCPVNPLDANANRQFCPDGAPADNFDPNDVVYDLDRLVEIGGLPNVSTSHPRLEQGGLPRIGASNAEMAGPLGSQTIRLLADPDTGVILDAWLDADGQPQGELPNLLQQ